MIFMENFRENKMRKITVPNQSGLIIIVIVNLFYFSCSYGLGTYGNFSSVGNITYFNGNFGSFQCHYCIVLKIAGNTIMFKKMATFAYSSREHKLHAEGHNEIFAHKY